MTRWCEIRCAPHPLDPELESSCIWRPLGGLDSVTGCCTTDRRRCIRECYSFRSMLYSRYTCYFRILLLYVSTVFLQSFSRVWCFWGARGIRRLRGVEAESLDKLIPGVYRVVVTPRKRIISCLLWAFPFVTWRIKYFPSSSMRGLTEVLTSRV